MGRGRSTLANLGTGIPYVEVTVSQRVGGQMIVAWVNVAAMEEHRGLNLWKGSEGRTKLALGGCSNTEGSSCFWPEK